MSGGMAEYVMGVYNKTIGRSGFNSLPDSKYYNNYTGSSYTGHALTETKGWYNDTDSLAYEGSPWFTRGGSFNDGTRAGVLNFSRYDGNSGGTNSSRFVITNE